MGKVCVALKLQPQEIANCVEYVSEKDDQETKVTTLLRTTIPGLRKYTNYSITVMAFTISGDGVRSPSVFCHTDEDGKALDER